MDIQSVIDVIEEIAPLSGAASWDKSGLQVASHRTSVHKLAVALDPIPSSIAAALEHGADMVLTHHPLSLNPTLPTRLDNYHKTLFLLLSADVPLYACHTSLDVQPDGPVGWLARELGLLHPVFLEQTGDACGFGLVGDLPEAIELDTLLCLLGKRVDLSTATLTGACPSPLRRVAYCAGSGGSLLSEAEASGADLYITGDIKYHVALDTRIPLLDVGHHGLEEEMMLEMQRLLSRRLQGVESFFVPSSSPFRRVRIQ